MRFFPNSSKFTANIIVTVKLHVSMWDEMTIQMGEPENKTPTSSYSFFFFICCVFLPSFTFSASISTHSISPDFTASNFQFIDTSGAFLRSQNGTFKATIDAMPPSSKYYFSVVHTATNIIIWSANRNRPMSSSDQLSLTVNGLTVTT